MHRFTSYQGITLIKNFEGFSQKKYLCPGGFATIGYGHKLLADEDFDFISAKEAEELLAKDLLLIEKNVIKYINVPLTQNQFDALVSFTFNLGAAALQRSTLRQKINYQQYFNAAEEFLKWIYIKGKIIKGLIKRRIAEKELFIL